MRVRRELARSDPANADVLYAMSESLGDIAELRTEAATRATASEADSRKHWTEARTAYQEGREVLLGMQRQGMRKGVVDKDLAKITVAIDRCNVALMGIPSRRTSGHS